MGSHFRVGVPPILLYFSGDWDVHCRYDLDFDPWPHERWSKTTTSSPDMDKNAASVKLETRTRHQNVTRQTGKLLPKSSDSEGKAEHGRACKTSRLGPPVERIE